MKVIKLTKTCEACPSQWEGTLEDGRMIYIRYRWGYLSVRISEDKTEDIGDAVALGDEIFGKQINERPLGFMDYEELVKLTSHILDYSNVEEENSV